MVLGELEVLTQLWGGSKLDTSCMSGLGTLVSCFFVRAVPIYANKITVRRNTVDSLSYFTSTIIPGALVHREKSRYERPPLIGNEVGIAGFHAAHTTLYSTAVAHRRRARFVRVGSCLGLRCAAAFHAAVEVHHKLGSSQFGKRGGPAPDSSLHGSEER